MRTILLDGDIVAYKYAASAEKPIDWGDDLWTLHADAKTSAARIDDHIAHLLEKLKADAVVIALTDAENWRKSVLPTYKSNRKDQRKPTILGPMREHMAVKYTVYQRPTLEGDDVIGILATGSAINGEKIVVSIDKDMKTIPGLHFNAEKPDAGIVEISPAEAALWHMMQTLTGDKTDGYDGCPGIGPKRALAILMKCAAASKKFSGLDLVKAWSDVVETFEKQGLGAEEALRQARVARICWNTDYDFKNKRVKLWNPPV